MRATMFNGIAFIEGEPAKYEIVEKITVEIGGLETHLKTLDDVKKAMAAKAKAAGGNAIVDFKYGQKAASFWQSLFQIDDVSYHGSGIIAKVWQQDLKPKI